MAVTLTHDPRTGIGLIAITQITPHHRSASCVAAKPDLLNQTVRVKATNFLEPFLRQLCGSGGFGLIGMTGEQEHQLHVECSVALDQAATPLRVGKFARAQVAKLVGCLPAILFASAISS
jgi:hypothetical protein